MKHFTPRIIAAPLALAALLSACNSQGSEQAAANATDAAANGTAPVELPPMVIASHNYRCKDNSLAKIEYMSDKTAMLTLGDAAPVKLTQAADGEPFTAEGYSATGPSKDVTITAPGKGTQDCKA